MSGSVSCQYHSVRSKEKCTDEKDYQAKTAVPSKSLFISLLAKNNLSFPIHFRYYNISTCVLNLVAIVLDQ